MKTFRNIFFGLLLLGLIGRTCESCTNSSSRSSPSDDHSTTTGSEPSSQVSSSSEQYVLDATSISSCENYLKGKTYRGGSARLQFGYDGTVSAYAANGNLVFGGTLEIGAKESEVSRWIYVRDMSGGGKLQFLLSADGKMMEPSSLVIYKPS